jgi:teichuronic acid biosynthesis glycosyltransferase TuaC
MKSLYLTFNNSEHKTGLFYSTHHRIKNAIPLLQHYKILNIQFYDNWFLSILKIIFGIKPRKRGQHSFFFDGLTYSNFWIKRSIFSSATPWGKFDKWRNSNFLCSERYISHKKLTTVVELSNNFDVIIAHWGYPIGRIAMQIGKITHKPYFVTFHGSDLNVISQKNRILKKSIAETIQNADMNILVSHALWNKMHKITPVFKAFISPNGICKNIINTKKIKPHNEFGIIFIGNLNEDKRADKLAEIIKSITAKATDKLKFTIIGTGKFENFLKIQLTHSIYNVDFLGHLPNNIVIENLAKASMLILPSRREGLPLVILEAIAVNVIPVASNVGGISEILEKDFLVDVSESFINDFANKVIHLMNNPKFPSLEIDDYSWKHIIEKEIKLIKEITEDVQKRF